MTNHLMKYENYLTLKSLPKLVKFIEKHNITRPQLIRFLQREGMKVLKKESTDDIIRRINSEFPLPYIAAVLPKIKVKKASSKFDIDTWKADDLPKIKEHHHEYHAIKKDFKNLVMHENHKKVNDKYLNNIQFK